MNKTCCNQFIVITEYHTNSCERNYYFNINNEGSIGKNVYFKKALVKNNKMKILFH